MKTRYFGLLLALFMVVLGLSFSMSALAAYPSVSKAKPLKAYGWQVKDYPVYSDDSLTTMVTKIEYSELNVLKIKDDAVQILYKDDEGESVKGWIPLKKLVYNPDYKHQVSFANTSFTIYKRPTARAAYVTIPQYSGGITVSERGNWVEVLFTVGNNYYLGWMTKSSWQTCVRLSMETTTQPLANGTYILIPRNASGKALTASSGSLTLAANKKRQSQKFTLRYVSSGYYQITTVSSDSYLSDSSGLSLSSDNTQMWKIFRTGGYFYIRSKSTGKGLRSSTSGKLSLKKAQKLTSQQWKLVKVSETPSVESSVVFSQYDPKWGGSTYYSGATRKTIASSGCGVMALVNAIYALNGEFISPTMLASFSASRGHYFYNQGTADTLYQDFANVYGSTYHFKHVGKTTAVGTLRSYLQKGCVAVALVPGHYIAIVGYNSATNQYLVLDSAVYGKRPTTIDGDWVSAATLKSGTMYCEYFHIFSKR